MLPEERKPSISAKLKERTSRKVSPKVKKERPVTGEGDCKVKHKQEMALVCKSPYDRQMEQNVYAGWNKYVTGKK